jgi:hypothetical protein
VKAAVGNNLNTCGCTAARLAKRKEKVVVRGAAKAKNGTLERYEQKDTREKKWGYLLAMERKGWAKGTCRDHPII